MRCRQITVTTTPTNLLDLLGIQDVMRGSVTVLLETPSTNTNDVFYGDAGAQHMVLSSAGDRSALLPIHSLENLYFVVAAGTEVVNVMVFYARI